MKGSLLLWLALMCLLPCILSRVHTDEAALNTRDEKRAAESVDGDDKIQEVDDRALLDVAINELSIDKRIWIRTCKLVRVYGWVRHYYWDWTCQWWGCWSRWIFKWIWAWKGMEQRCNWVKIWGEPHYTTFDGRLFEFQGTCAYILTKACSSDITPFRILSENYYASNTQRKNKVSSPKNVILEANGHTVVINHDRRLIVDGMERRLPLMIGDNTTYITAHTAPDKIIVTTDFGVAITVRGLDSIGLNVPKEYEGKVCGLLGNYDGNPDNDFDLPNGTTAPDAITFANHWKDPDLSNPRCDNGLQLSTDACDTPGKKAQVDKLCGGLNETNGVFKKCYSKVSADAFNRDCVFDMCNDFGNVDFLCNAYEMYAAACAEEGILVDWRKKMKKYCKAKCMKHGKYEIKTSLCMNNCAAPDSEDDCDVTLPRVQGCKCTGNRLYDNGQCLEPTGCGCTGNDGYYHQKGDSWYESDCTKVCRCRGVKNIDCKDVTGCHGDLTCMDQPDGSKDCRCKPGTPCAKRCIVAIDGTLSSPLAIGYNLPEDTELVIARTDKGGSDPCKAQVMVSTDSKGEVDGAVVSVGVKSSDDDKYAREYKFDEKKVSVSGDKGKKGKKGKNGKKGKKNKSPIADWDNGSVSVSVSEDSPGHKMTVKCGDNNLFTFTYKKSNVKYVDLEVEDEHSWTGRCYDY